MSVIVVVAVAAFAAITGSINDTAGAAAVTVPIKLIATTCERDCIFCSWEEEEEGTAAQGNDNDEVDDDDDEDDEETPFVQGVVFVVDLVDADLVDADSVDADLVDSVVWNLIILLLD